MNNTVKLLTNLSLMATFLSACSGGDGGSNFIGVGPGTNRTGSISIGISDAPVDDVEEVWVKIDKITFKKVGEDDVVVDRFTSTDLGISDVDSFQIDLLQYQGGKQAIVIDDMTLAAGKYTDIILSILDENINDSYVIEQSSGNAQKAIKVPSDTLKLGGFTVDADGVQTFTIEFNLRQAMTYTPGPDTYILKPRGIRLQDNDGDRTISGAVDSSLFDTESPCDQKIDPLLGNIVYLYEGHNLNANNLADVFDPANSANAVPANAIEPFAAEAVVANGNQWRYSFAFLPAGDYTLAFSCDAENDDPEDYDGLTLPFPVEQVIELTTGNSSAVCDLPIDNNACS